jgi:threonyl-tRNA synthetase
MFVVGGKEAEAQSVAVRSRDSGDLGVQTIAESIEKLLQEAKK